MTTKPISQSSQSGSSRQTDAPQDAAWRIPISRRAALVTGAAAVAGLLVRPNLFAAPATKRTVVVWSEGTANVDAASKEVYPKDINSAIAEGLKPLERQGWQVVLASLPDPDQGISFKLPKIERYGEPFAVPTPEAVPLEGIYTKPDGSTEPGRMGMCWTVGKGRVFYFTPGHETYNDYYRPEVRQIFVNAVPWAAPKYE